MHSECLTADVVADPEDLRCLRTERDRMGHDLPGLAAYDDEVTEASVDLPHPGEAG